MSVINETISGIYFIKTHVAYNVFLNRLGKLFSSFAHKSLKYTLTSSLSSSLIYSLINPLMAIYVLIYGISFIKTGTPSIGAIFAYTNYFGIVFPAVVSVYNLYFKAASITVNVERVLEYLHSKPEESGRIEEFNNYTIYIKNLSFSYNTNQILLRDISLEIPEGSSVAIVGETGSGKSTLVNLLLRIFDVTDGSIGYGSYDIKEYNTDFLRKNIAIVSQEPFLFNTSVKENLMYANPSSTMEEIINATKLAQIHDRILQLPDGYDSIIGENGIKLSGGEKQRLSISRLILRNPKIVIMDEPTSSLDIITERKLMSGILNILKDKTVILITHKLFMLEQFDKIIVLNKGKATQYNSYHELISKQRSLKE
jgi:ABC-type multidrug transport system fused ATPase/permease subunit